MPIRQFSSIYYCTEHKGSGHLFFFFVTAWKFRTYMILQTCQVTDVQKKFTNICDREHAGAENFFCRLQVQGDPPGGLLCFTAVRSPEQRETNEEGGGICTWVMKVLDFQVRVPKMEFVL